MLGTKRMTDLSFWTTRYFVRIRGYTATGILYVFLWLKFSPALSLTELKRFKSGSNYLTV